ncbi:hypothetical protein KPH14_000929, partial [Odynerus spinipes]
VVLDEFIKWGPNDSLRLDTLTRKLVTLLALTTGHRMQTLTFIDIRNFVLRGDRLEIKIVERVKTSAINKVQPLLILPFFKENPLPVHRRCACSHQACWPVDPHQDHATTGLSGSPCHSSRTIACQSATGVLPLGLVRLVHLIRPSVKGYGSATTRSLDRQPLQRQAYYAFMRDYLDSGHMELVPADIDFPVYESYYIPHHSVHRSDDPPMKLRVVFNASCVSSNGLELRKWASNNPPLLQDLPADNLRTPAHTFSSDATTGIPLDRDPGVKLLGLGWNPTAYHFFYAVLLDALARTKRMILSQMARIFDPLGWFTPISLRAKFMFRQLCLLQVDWDQALPASATES